MEISRDTFIQFSSNFQWRLTGVRPHYTLPPLEISSSKLPSPISPTTNSLVSLLVRLNASVASWPGWIWSSVRLWMQFAFIQLRLTGVWP